MDGRNECNDDRREESLMAANCNNTGPSVGSRWNRWSEDCSSNDSKKWAPNLSNN